MKSWYSCINQPADSIKEASTNIGAAYKSTNVWYHSLVKTISRKNVMGISKKKLKICHFGQRWTKLQPLGRQATRLKSVSWWGLWLQGKRPQHNCIKTAGEPIGNNLVDIWPQLCKEFCRCWSWQNNIRTLDTKRDKRKWDCVESINLHQPIYWWYFVQPRFKGRQHNDIIL